MNETLEVNKCWREYHQLSVKINDLKHLHRTSYPKKVAFCQNCFAVEEWGPRNMGKSQCCGKRIIGIGEAVELLEQQKSAKMDRIAELYGQEDD